jgi:thioredoxin 1
MVKALTSAEFKEQVLSGKGRILVDFSAVWCGPCRMMAPVVEQLEQEKEGQLSVYSVDVDACPDVAANFGISAVPTLVLFDDGKAVRSTMGAQPIENLRKFVEA